MNLHLLRVLLAGLCVMAATVALAQQPAPRPPPPAIPVEPEAPAGKLSDPSAVPGFWDPRHRPERPDLSRVAIIRFLTETDYPPFNFAGPDGAPTGFNVELARAICDEMKVACTIQMRRFDTLIDSLDKNQGDAVIASLSRDELLSRLEP